jgi:hypothetical protein
MRIQQGVAPWIAGLAAAALLVGTAIVLDSDFGRAVNGVGGLLWFASTAMLTHTAVRSRPPAWLWGALALVVLTVAFIVKPSAVLPAIIGFVPAGFVMAMFGGQRKILWAALVPAWYLPAHIGTAVAKSAVNSLMGNEASLRTDPPPTAAIVPLLMIACALIGGALARYLNVRRSAGQAGERRLAEER